MSNANKLNIDKLSEALYQKGFSIHKSYDTYSGRPRTFLNAWKDGDSRYAFLFRDWTKEIELTSRNQFFSRLYADGDITQDIITARMLVDACWEE